MVEKNLDFRSDTVTWPSPEMREASYKAVVGDDVYGDDPTVNELEAIAAEMLGKEAGLFVTSGTQGNAVAILARGYPRRHQGREHPSPHHDPALHREHPQHVRRDTPHR